MSGANNSSLSITLLTLVVLPLMFWNCSEVGFQQAKDDLSKSNCNQSAEGCGGNTGLGVDDDDDGGDPKTDLVAQTVDKDLDYRVPAPSNKVDILLVIDTSESMNVERNLLAQRLDGLTDKLDGEGIDWQMCHVFTDLFNRNGEAIRWAGINDIVLSSSSLNPSQRRSVFLNSLVDLEIGDGDEQGIGATYRAIQRSGNSDCFRSDGGLAVILISDEDERSCGGRSSCDSADFEQLETINIGENLNSFVGNRFNGQKPFTFHSIVIRPNDQSCLNEQQNQIDEFGRQWAAYYGVEYAALSDLTGGVLGSVCEDDYQSQINNIGDVVIETLDSVPLECTPTNGSLTVQVFDAGGNRDNSRSISVDGNKLVFVPALTSGYRVTGDYQCIEFVRPN
ncbi:MAG: hypothetical protein AAF202_00920 [Pseudomonadota bacterium]